MTTSREQVPLGTKLYAGGFLWALFGLPFLLTVGLAVAFLMFVARFALFAVAVVVAAAVSLHRVIQGR